LAKIAAPRARSMPAGGRLSGAAVGRCISPTTCGSVEAARRQRAQNQ
jgi:hypothetical protein